MSRSAWISLGIFLSASLTWAEVTTEKIAYQDGDVALEGYFAVDSSEPGEKKPGILVVHEWWGLNDHARRVAQRLAEEGYAAFALDMYGAGRVTQHPAEAGQWASAIRKNTDDWMKRARAGLAILSHRPEVDAEKLAAIGYCFGGSTVLELGFRDPSLSAVISFHGALPVPPVDLVKSMRAKVLVCHGSADSFITQERIEEFQKGMNEGGADWLMVSYGKAKHSFTNPDADKAGIPALAYNAEADARSWRHMHQLLDEVFSR